MLKEKCPDVRVYSEVWAEKDWLENVGEWERDVEHEALRTVG